MSRSTPGHLGTQDDVILARVGAFLIDHVLSVVAGTLAILLYFVAVSPDPTGAGAPLVGGLVAAVVWIAYFVLSEGLYGQTPGKRATGVVVVDRSGAPITMKQSLVRNVLRVIDGIGSYAVGLVVMLLGEDRQRIGDLAADTLVVRARR